ncbi:NAD(P)-binding domain-containing protein [Mesorhizobium qingshengii]|uniref:Trimethylamine monooxygenase n=1 Tax=Mesorhizobium qingshengii TaxID=1165689 RepID=A0ABT4R1Z6_9HYPH|nr:NAD(P)-binding domain-containing protein [Mesorhizobium qingshengii]MCZ8547851.1 NAD(P)-binding domain-containing protein [Mesorhizobium qingshengii]
MTASHVEIHPGNHVAVIGAGPGGLAAAAWLSRNGFEPVVFEVAERLGGQWNAGQPMSGTWAGMRTNTSRVLSAFSDLDHAPGTPVYPTQAEMLAYLERYAAATGTARRIRTGTPVERLERHADGGWLVTSRANGALRAERFGRVVVATGRQARPHMPEVAGIGGFTGSGGVRHSMHYQGAAAYRGLSVLVTGCSISALEIASELAAGGAARVSVASRRQRYVLGKLLAGVPADHLAFTRFAALAGPVTPPEMLAAGLKGFVVGTSGSPEQFGAPRPDDNIFAAGLTQSQNYLPLVAEGRIAPRPWIERVEGDTVCFTDGTSEQVDAIIMGTGYALSLPFLGRDIAEALELDGQHVTLADHTFHPDLEGLAFIGLYDQVGPLLPVLELQARWLSYVWSGRVAAPSRTELDEGLAASRAARNGPPQVLMHDMAVLFARRIGAEPDPRRWPDLTRALMFGPLSPASFRLEGPDRLPEAPARTRAAAAAFGAIASNEMTPDEAARWAMIEAAALAPVGEAA